MNFLANTLQIGLLSSQIYKDLKPINSYWCNLPRPDLLLSCRNGSRKTLIQFYYYYDYYDIYDYYDYYYDSCYQYNDKESKFCDNTFSPSTCNMLLLL